ncbi:[NiFe] hydrogenase assembly HybE family chaperone [Rhodovulum iodosum]|uniref:[NiFe] hydrogenase assembly HybE family chaperone n=1 Tax=Rhodovulum iodosum TaxID=68291 RepID=A0ABV3XNR4_9RHOB|nr:[NiFe]-hydrogenase assembly chaperone HybE [Rhodovulum robiginosum]RSK34852.1 [NiFe]-hydrogenase assembly, chaperone, HybE [Rhodovulum robiginosum]
MTAPRFEGSYLGADDRISAAAIMECKICWTVYDPAEGDDYRQVLPETPFAALPDDWTCPTCGAPREQFMVREDPGAQAGCSTVYIAQKAEALAADFREVWNSKMRDVPLVNKSLHVEAVGFAAHEGRPLGVLVAPWFMNLVLLPAEGEDWRTLTPGAKEAIAFPSGSYEFIHNVRPMVGGYKACSLFSPMSDFASQMQAVEIARAVMSELFKAENRTETDRTADIRATREADLAAAQEAESAERVVADVAPTRRTVISAGMAPERDTGSEA